MNPEEVSSKSTETLRKLARPRQKKQGLSLSRVLSTVEERATDRQTDSGQARPTAESKMTEMFGNHLPNSESRRCTQSSSPSFKLQLQGPSVFSHSLLPVSSVRQGWGS